MFSKRFFALPLIQLGKHMPRTRWTKQQIRNGRAPISSSTLLPPFWYNCNKCICLIRLHSIRFNDESLPILPLSWNVYASNRRMKKQKLEYLCKWSVKYELIKTKEQWDTIDEMDARGEKRAAIEANSSRMIECARARPSCWAALSAFIEHIEYVNE